MKSLTNNSAAKKANFPNRGVFLRLFSIFLKSCLFCVGTLLLLRSFGFITILEGDCCNAVPKRVCCEGGKLIVDIKDKKVNVKQPSFFCGDKNVDCLTFSIDKTYNGLSLKDIPVYVKTKNGLGACYKRLLEAKEQDGKLYIEWKLGEEATSVGGRLLCQIVFENDDGSVVLNTKTFNVFIGESVPNNGVMLAGSGQTIDGSWRDKVIEISAIIEKGVVNSVNGRTGNVVIAAADLDALPTGAKMSLLNNDCGFVKSSDVSAVVSAHNIADDAHSDIRAAIAESNKEIAGTTVTALFDSVSVFVGAVVYFNDNKMKKGDIARIVESGIADLYVKRVESSCTAYLYTTKAAFAEKLAADGEIKVGYYVFAAVKSSGGSGGSSSIGDSGIDNSTIIKNTNNQIQAIGLTNGTDELSYADFSAAITIERL